MITLQRLFGLTTHEMGIGLSFQAIGGCVSSILGKLKFKICFF